ncbi:hypothetical protein ACTFIU_006658 [Dictyostelium citrinum]
MSKTKTLISLVLVVIAFALATAAFSLYWYQDGNTVEDYSYRFNGVLEIFNGDDGEFVKYSDLQKDIYKNMIIVINACVAFNILAWILFFFCIVLLLIQLTGKLNDFTIFKKIGKFIMVVATGCILLSVFILLAMPGAKKKDCLIVNYKSVCDQKDFSLYSSKNGKYQYPGISWYLVIISSAFSISSAILNFLGAI